MKIYRKYSQDREYIRGLMSVFEINLDTVTKKFHHSVLIPNSYNFGESYSAISLQIDLVLVLSRILEEFALLMPSALAS